MPGLWDYPVDMPNDRRLRGSMSVAYSIGHALRSEWPPSPVVLSMQIWQSRCLAEELELLFERMTGLPAAQFESKDLHDRALLIRDAYDEIERLTGEA